MAKQVDNPFEMTPVYQSVTETDLQSLTGVKDEGSTSDREKAIIKRLRSKHPDYEENEEKWLFFQKSYDGGPEYISSDTIFKHERENKESYDDRLKRAHYTNYCKPLVDFVPEFIFSTPVVRNPESAIRPVFSEWEHNVDLRGTNMDLFMREVTEDARTFGHVFVGLDKLPVPEGEDLSKLSLQRAKELKVVVPYLFIVRPLEVFDWNMDKFGNFDYLKRVEIVWKRGVGGSRKIERYSEWMKDVVLISEIDVTNEKKPRFIGAQSAENKWGFIPFVPFFNDYSKANREIGLSFLQDIAYQNRTATNYTSLIQEFLYRQAFNLLAMEQDTNLPTVENQNGEIGTSNVSEYPKGGKAPEYISPPIDPAEFIQSERESTIAEMYRTAANDAMGDLFGSDKRSGDAARQSMSRMAPSIAKLADYLQATETRVLTLWAKMQGKEWKGTISYRDDYSVQSLMDLILQLSSIFNSIKPLSPSFIRHEWLRIIRTFDGRIERETMEKIIQEIKAVSDDDIIDLIKGAKAQTGEDFPTTAQMTQGKEQKSLGDDKRIGMRRNDKTATKEGMQDGRKRTSWGNKNRSTAKK